ncbi:MAG: fibrobacter succinogenes major paralogous domain-containing protein [Fibromonadaceae bacterium]|jgi:uncharacterized protein (TIGR02145 family)|nr:fibrobacter succinogenes major paralogous domain-containing protein [Fibromonadaceae bacterium]
MSKIATFLLLCTLLCVVACEPKYEPQIGTFTDQRDNKTYKTVKIGEQVWMAENLNYEAEGSRCYNDSTAYCDKYGRLYAWETAMKACPDGWHLPSDAEWKILIATVGNAETAGKSLKAVNGWKENGNGKDKFGFSALPGGSGSDGGFDSVGYYGYWWSTIEYSSYFAYYRDMVYYFNYHDQNYLYSVRCIQDKPFNISLLFRDPAGIRVSLDTINGNVIETLLYPYSIDIVNDSIIFTARKWRGNKEYRGKLTDEQQLKIKNMVSALNQEYEFPSLDDDDGPGLGPWACILEIDNQVRYIRGGCEDNPEFTHIRFKEKMPEEIRVLFRYIIDLSPIVPMGFQNSRKRKDSGTTIAHQKDTFTDKRDGKTYKTTKIGKLVWMAENLNYELGGSKCYAEEPKNCKKYGRLYNWKTAKEACPEGWHLPSKEEWQKLIKAVGDEKTAGKYLKAKSGWDDVYEGKFGNGDDKYGFSALPGGFGSSDDNFSVFAGYGNNGSWWTATEHKASYAYLRNIYNDSDYVNSKYKDKTFLLSVRCVQDD